MAEEKSTEKQVRLNAPTYMRPKDTVLDAPLDIDAGKKVVQRPVAHEFHKVAIAEPTVTVESTQVVEPFIAVEVPVVENAFTVDEEVTVEEEISPAATEETPVNEFSMDQGVESADEAVEAEEIAAPRRKGMTVFQQFIVMLLLLVVAMFLATIYLYINGWIELPQIVLNLVDKVLALIN